MKSCSDTRGFYSAAGDGGAPAARVQDATADQHAAGDLERRHPLGEQDEREDRRDERLQVRDQRRARRRRSRAATRNQRMFVSTSGPSVAKTSSSPDSSRDAVVLPGRLREAAGAAIATQPSGSTTALIREAE